LEQIVYFVRQNIFQELAHSLGHGGRFSIGTDGDFASTEMAELIPGNQFCLNPKSIDKVDFFCNSAKYKRIASFQSHHVAVHFGEAYAKLSGSTLTT
jgi:hypothetical protein